MANNKLFLLCLILPVLFLGASAAYTCPQSTTSIDDLCSQLQQIYGTWYYMYNNITNNSAQLSSIPLNDTDNFFQTGTLTMCSDIGAFIQRDEISDDDDYYSLKSHPQQKRRAGRAGRAGRTGLPAAAVDTTTTSSTTQPGLVQNKVKRNRKLRNKQQTAYSAIYSSFLDIDIDFDTDFDTDSDTTFEAESQTNTGRRRATFNRKIEKTNQYPNITTSELDDLFGYGNCWISYYNIWVTDPDEQANVVYWMQDWCNNAALPFVVDWGTYFPNNGFGTDNYFDRLTYLWYFNSDIINSAYNGYGCTW